LAKKTVFVRDATGLVRGLSGFDAFNINFAWLNILVGTLWTFSWTPVVFPGAYLPITLALVVVPLIFLGELYVIMSSSMPRSGGDYVWTSRILHPAVGVAISLYVVFFFWISIGMQADFLSAFYLSGLFPAFARIFNNPGLAAWGSIVQQPSWIMTIGTIGVAIYFLSAVAGVRIHAKVLFVLFLGAMAAMVTLIGLLLVTSHSAAVSMINTNLAGSGNTYDSIITLAQKNGYTTGWTPLQSIAALPYAYTFYWGFYNSNWFVGEVKGVAKSMNRAIQGSLLFSAVVSVLIAYLTFNVFGYDFYNGLNYLFFNASSSYPTVVASPYFNYLLTLLTDSPIIVVVIMIGFLMNGLWQLVCGAVPATRNLFAMSFDRILPTKFSDVNERLHSPLAAIIFMAILGEVSVYLYAFTTLALYLVNTTIGLLICNLIVAVACLTYPFRLKDTFEATIPLRWKKKVAGLPMLSWLAIIVLIPTLYMIYVGFTNPIIGGPISYASMFVGVFGAMIVGIVIYYVAYAYRKAQGLDLKMVFSQIPPE
jgi:APA family basic amino acid/polyamine antiporter